MKIVSKGRKVASTKLIVPIDGLIEIDGNGVADVSAKCAVVLVNNTNDWEYLGKKKAEEPVKTETSDEEETVDETEETESEENTEDETEGEEEVEKSERELLEEKINGSTVAQLREMCKEAEFPEAEWNKLSKPLLIKYMLKKYDEA